MREQLQARLAELEAEILVGERRWHEVEQEQVRLRETLLRMSGAIQILKELLEQSPDAEEAAIQVSATTGNGMESSVVSR